MKLIVGLGNPGDKYKNTRHNVGFMVVGRLAKSLRLNTESKFKSEICWLNTNVLVIKPWAFMNLSGEAVSLVKNYYKIPTSDIWVVHDDVDLEVGRIKIQIGGGSAGHNGLNSIIESIGDSDFVRFRVGVGRPLNANISVEDYVLQGLSGGEAIEECVKAINDALEKGLEYAKSQNYSTKT